MWANELNRLFTKDIKMANRNMQRCSMSLIFRKMQIKTKLNAASYLLEWLTLKQLTLASKAKIWNNWNACAAGSNVKWYHHFGETICFLKSTWLWYDSDMPFLGTIQKKWEYIYSQRLLNQFYSLYPQNWMHFKCPSTKK